jgi:hypothetical protein
MDFIGSLPGLFWSVSGKKSKSIFNIKAIWQVGRKESTVKRAKKTILCALVETTHRFFFIFTLFTGCETEKKRIRKNQLNSPVDSCHRLFFGASMVALPTAIEQSGTYVGFILCIVVTIISILTGMTLSESWRILVKNWPEFRQFIRKPYAEIGGHAVGKWVKTLSSISVNLSQFGIVIVLVLLASKNIHDVLSTFFDAVPHLCIWILIISVFVFPFTLLKSPEDFWFLIVASGGATFAGVILIIIGASMDYEECRKEIAYTEFNVIKFFVGLGTIVFGKILIIFIV